MRLDKLTTAFQQALADAQSLAVARDNPYIEPAHLLAAMLAQPDGPKALLDRAGANTAALKHRDGHRDRRACRRCRAAASRCSPDATWWRCCRPPKRKPASAATSSSPARCSCWRWPTARPTSAASCAATASRARRWRPRSRRVRGGQKVDSAEAEGQREALKKYTLDLTERAAQGQARPGDRPRRRDPPRDPGAAAAHQEQPGADRRARCRQDGDRRGPGAAHRQRRGARDR